MRIEQARRITGRHLLIPGPGAAAEVLGDPAEVDAYLASARALLARCGLPDALVVRRWPGGASVAVEAPVDRLLAAAEALERAPDGDAGAVLDAVEDEPDLRAAVRWAKEHDVPAFFDDRGFTLGLGRHGRTWDHAPPVAELERAGAGRVPFVYVTGTNGKTTTARWLTRMLREGGVLAGQTSSDGVVVGDRWLERGDCTGPGGARLLLRDSAVETAVIEVARGGLLRRGLVLDGADVAVVTNVGEDHLGEWGVFDLDGMAEVKLLVADALRPGGTLVANAGCVASIRQVARVRARRPDLVVRWVGEHARIVGEIAHLDGEPLATVGEIPLALGGAAAYNLENALMAALAAQALGVPREAIRRALLDFHPTPEDNPGRTNLFEVGDATVLLDFAHNPDALTALADFARRWPASRRTVVVGLAGDRTNELVTAFAHAIASMGPDRVVLKELPKYRRGRAPGELRGLLRRDLRDAGVADAAILDVEDEDEAVRTVLSTLVPGELAIVCVHEDADLAVRRVRDRQK